MLETDGAVGIFDSGVGGLTVLAQVMERLPNESIIYLGDTARVPYGTKSGETVIRYARACAELLIERDVKTLVVACNTASAHALDVLRDELGIPVLGVIEPGARTAVRSTRNGHVGVIGTASTIGSGAYEDAICSFSPDAKVYSKACPLFVPLAEEGWTAGRVPELVVAEYLGELMNERIDTLVLGCTHYPLLKSVIARTVGDGVVLVDSAEETSAALMATLDAMDLRRSEENAPEYRFLVTDAPESFARVGRHFLGRDIGPVEWVDF